MADQLIFYTHPMSRGRIVRWMFEEIGQPYDVVKTIADTLGIAARTWPLRQRCDPCSLACPAKPETELVVEIKQIIASQPTYGYRRVHALIGRWRREEGGVAVERQTRLPDHESPWA